MPRKQLRRIHASSGTTGKPTVVGYTENDLEVWKECVARLAVAGGATDEDVAQICFGYGMFTGALGLHNGLEKVGAAIVPSSTGNTQTVSYTHLVGFTVEQGEYVAIRGESGSGKITLLNILAALDRPTSGSVLLDGTDLSTVKESGLAAFRRDNLGFVFQDLNLLDTFSVRDNILLPLVQMCIRDRPYLLHDSEPALVLISFRYLLIIDNQYGSHHKQGAKEYSQE